MANPRSILYGDIHLETIVSNDTLICSDALGGSLIYSAAGYALWQSGAGLLSISNNELSDNNLISLEHAGFDTKGIVITQKRSTIRRFIDLAEGNFNLSANPIEWFAIHNQPLPRKLWNYSILNMNRSSKDISANKAIGVDVLIPFSYREAQYILVNLDDIDVYFKFLATVQKPITRILAFDANFLQHTKKDQLHFILQGDQNIVIHRRDLFVLERFNEKLRYPLEALSFLQALGGENIIMINDDEIVFTKKDSGTSMQIVRYPVQQKNRLYEQAVLAGGMLAGLISDKNIIESIQMGIISMSIMNQLLPVQLKPDILPELLQARLEWLKENTTYKK